MSSQGIQIEVLDHPGIILTYIVSQALSSCMERYKKIHYCFSRITVIIRNQLRRVYHRSIHGLLILHAIDNIKFIRVSHCLWRHILRHGIQKVLIQADTEVTARIIMILLPKSRKHLMNIIRRLYMSHRIIDLYQMPVEDSPLHWEHKCSGSRFLLNSYTLFTHGAAAALTQIKL